ncbi:hypothetical protein SDJN03_15268, partial [Cucurbita argyrosperma subsp. sororia]
MSGWTLLYGAPHGQVQRKGCGHGWTPRLDSTVNRESIRKWQKCQFRGIIKAHHFIPKPLFSCFLDCTVFQYFSAPPPVISEIPSRTIAEFVFFWEMRS